MTADSAFARLAPFLREFVYKEAWAGLRPVQVEAINTIFDEDCDVLIAAGTASGKTEAAFLPILSQIQSESRGSVRALYVGPLKALINDQFRRLERVCEQGDIPVYKWHGDVSASDKAELLKRPGGVLQITPESIESLFINKTESLRRLFGGLRFIVIDEVHAFLESDRGVQLRTQLERLNPYCKLGRPRRVGLSATVGDFEVAKRWLNVGQPASVRLINPAGVTVPIRYNHLHFSDITEELPAELINDLYRLTKARKAIVFCNTRGDVEITTSKLNRLCQREGLAEKYLPHHGSISNEIREEAEARMKEDGRPSVVVSTNTLELGIDIGQLDLVVQINSALSVNSFIQRLGRSGRREGEPRIMQLYTTQQKPKPDAPFYERLPFNLLKGLAVAELFLEGWAEPPQERTRPYNVLYHQMVSRVTETHGSQPRELIAFFLKSKIFPSVTPDEYAGLLTELATLDHLEQMPDGILILGLDGEKVVRSRDFYAVFKTPPEWSVTDGHRTLGRIAPSMDLQVGVCILLASKVWEVVQILPEEQQVIVKRAHQSQKVMFAGNDGPELHSRVAEKVRSILSDDKAFKYLSPAGETAVEASRLLSSELGLRNRRVLDTGDQWVIFPWAGTRAVWTLSLLLKYVGLKVSVPPGLFPWILLVEKEGQLISIESVLKKLLEGEINALDLLETVSTETLRTHKYDEFIPEELLRKRAVEERLDWEEARRLMSDIASELAVPCPNVGDPWQFG